MADTQVVDFRVDRAFLGSYANSLLRLRIEDPSQAERREGEELPVILPAHSTMRWGFDVRATGLGRRVTSDRRKVMRQLGLSTLKVRLGGGKTVKKMRVNLGIWDSIFEKLMEISPSTTTSREAPPE